MTPMTTTTCSKCREAACICGLRIGEYVHPADVAAVATGDTPSDNTPAPDYHTVSDLVGAHPRLREPIIFGVLRRTEVGNVISAPKMFKSWMVLDLALSVATGTKWFDFDTRPGRVLLIDWELHAETLAHRIPAVVQARGLDIRDIGDALMVESLRGRQPSVNINRLGDYFNKIGPGQFDLIIIDPLYRLFTPDADENSNVQLAALYGLLQVYAEQLNAAMMIVHHLTKGLQTDKLLTDLGAGGGAQSRAADAHLSLRHHAEEDAAVLAGVVRTWPPIPPVCVRWTYPVWTLAPDLDPGNLRRPAKRPPKSPPAEHAPAAPVETWTAARFAETFLTDTPQPKAAIVAKAKALGLGDRQAREFVTIAENDGLVLRVRQNRQNYFQRAESVSVRESAPPHTPPDSAEARPGLGTDGAHSDATDGEGGGE